MQIALDAHAATISSVTSTSSVTSVSRHQRMVEMVRCQGGVVCRSQLQSVGWTDDMIEAQLVSRRWGRLLPGVYATFGGGYRPITALWWAAHLFAGPESVLCGHSALQISGLGEPDAPVFVAVPWSRRGGEPADWLIVRRHRSRRSHRMKTDLPPFVATVDALIDVAADLSSREEVIDLVSGAMQRCRVSPRALDEALKARKAVRHRRLLASLVNEAGGGDTTPLEVAGTRRVLRAHGLPTGRGQVREQQFGSEVMRDRVIDEYGVVLEFDGRLGHADPRGRMRDHRRDNAVALSGRVVLRFGWADVHEEACEAAAQVAQVLTNRGWRGLLEACGPNCRAAGGSWVRWSG